MTEWGVVGVLVTLAAAAAAVVRPIVKLNTTITRLSVIIDQAVKNLEQMRQENEQFQQESKSSRRRIHGRIDELVKNVAGQGLRIAVLEQKNRPDEQE